MDLQTNPLASSTMPVGKGQCSLARNADLARTALHAEGYLGLR